MIAAEFDVQRRRDGQVTARRMGSDGATRLLCLAIALAATGCADTPADEPLIGRFDYAIAQSRALVYGDGLATVVATESFSYAADGLPLQSVRSRLTAEGSIEPDARLAWTYDDVGRPLRLDYTIEVGGTWRDSARLTWTWSADRLTEYGSEVPTPSGAWRADERYLLDYDDAGRTAAVTRQVSNAEGVWRGTNRTRITWDANGRVTERQLEYGSAENWYPNQSERWIWEEPGRLAQIETGWQNGVRWQAQQIRRFELTATGALAAVVELVDSWRNGRRDWRAVNRTNYARDAAGRVVGVENQQKQGWDGPWQTVSGTALSLTAGTSRGSERLAWGMWSPLHEEMLSRHGDVWVRAAP